MVKQMTTRPLKLHAEDWDMARDFLRATSFSACLRNGREFFQAIHNIDTLERAQQLGAEMEQAYATRGRRSLIYAVIGTYSVLVTPEVLACADVLANRAKEVVQ